MLAIQARKLEREYRLGGGNGVRALAGVDLDVEAGELAAILGKSGSGKSTLMNLVGGLDRPTGGTLEVFGQALAGLNARELADYRATTVGFVFQSFNLQARMPAWENVALPLTFVGVSRAERKRRAHELLERVGLGKRASHNPSELSGGEQQRVAIARALVGRPKLLLGDEPTGNLDTRTSEQVMELLTDINRAGTTLVIVTHNPELAQRHARRVITMADGLIRSDAAGGGVAHASGGTGNLAGVPEAIDTQAGLPVPPSSARATA